MIKNRFKSYAFNRFLIKNNQKIKNSLIILIRSNGRPAGLKCGPGPDRNGRSPIPIPSMTLVSEFLFLPNI